MHIDFQLKLQEVYAYTFGDFTKEEIDWVLNEHMFKFIEYRSDPKSNRKQEGFESTQKRYDDIESLITTTSLPVIENVGYVSAFLPSNYFKLVSERPVVSCSPKVIVEQSLSSLGINLINSTQTSVATYQLTISTNGDSFLLFDKADYTTKVLGQSEIPFLTALVINKLSSYKPGQLIAAWESIGDFHTPNKTAVVGYYDNITITITSTNSTGNTFTTTFTFSATTINKAQVANDSKEVDARLLNHEFLHRLLGNYFSRTRPDSPVCVIEDGIIKVYYSNFSVSSVNITYVKSPRLMSNSLSIDCELGSRTGQRYNICRQIVDAAVASVAGRISAGNTPILTENFLITE